MEAEAPCCDFSLYWQRVSPSTLLARIPVAALAGVTAYIGFCLLDWSAWARLLKMRKLDAAAFLTTAVGILFLNAAVAVGLGCAFYAIEPLLAMLPPIGRLTTTTSSQ